MKVLRIRTFHKDLRKGGEETEQPDQEVNYPNAGGWESVAEYQREARRRNRMCGDRDFALIEKGSREEMHDSHMGLRTVKYVEIVEVAK